MADPWESGFARHEGVLTWDGCSLEDLARKYGTPLFVASERSLLRSVRTLGDAFTSRGVEAEFFFSFKTNPLPRLLGILGRAGVGAEVISEFEFWLARRVGIEGERIVVNGTVKTGALLAAAVAENAALINVESVSQIQSLRDTVRRLGRRANVGLRVNPRLKSGKFDFTLSTGNASSPIGFVFGSREWEDVIALFGEEPLLRLRGVHFHLGSGIRRAAPYRSALKKIAVVWSDLNRRGFAPEILDIGGGFSTSTLKELNLWEAVRLLAWNLPQRRPSPGKEVVVEIAGECAGMLAGLTRVSGGAVPRLFVEPGRALSGPAQALLLQVTDLVDHRGGEVTAVCDGGAMNLSLMLLTEYHDIVPVREPVGGGRHRYNIVGSLPTPLDMVSRGRELPPLRRGDFIAVLETGAYFTSLGNTFAGSRPAVVLIGGEGPQVIRRRESFDDLVARDVID